MLKDKKIVIVGLGVLGGSYAKAFHKAGIPVKAVDIDTDALRTALSHGWISEGSSDPALIKEADLVIVCLYPHTFVNWIKANAHYLSPGTILTDVTGVKRAIIDQVDAVLPHGVEYIACHPMAGRESRGLAYADEKCFHGANFIIIPQEKNQPSTIALMEEMADLLGFGKVCHLSAEKHDRMIGFLSQLTHVIAVALMNTADNTDLADYTGDSFRDLTRIANINEKLWPELFVLNKDLLLQEIDGFVKEMLSFRSLIEQEDMAEMEERMRIATARRKCFDKKVKQ